MSGNFVQRGEMAVYDKFTRAKAALDNGADLIIEIPTVCATRSASGFAHTGVKILEGTGICDSIAFGAECADADMLLSLSREIEEKDSIIKEELKSGCSYPAAVSRATGSPLLDKPNNILALEYLRYTRLRPIVIKRIGKGHDTDDEEFSSSAIRKTLSGDEIASLKNCEKAVLYKLRTMSAEDFKNIEDVSEGLENKIVQAVKEAQSLDELYDLIKTKRYTHARIRRIVLRAFLGITSDMLDEPVYLRILGFNEKGRSLLTQMKKSAKLPIITSWADAKKAGGVVREAFETESKYTDIYNIGYVKPRKCESEKTSQIIIKENI
jgi:predicted nucleotidyltransferase